MSRGSVSRTHVGSANARIVFGPFEEGSSHVTAFQILGLLLTLSAAFAYVNFRWIRLPTSIGLMAMALSAGA